MSDEIREKIRTMMMSGDRELMNLSLILFWENDGTYQDASTMIKKGCTLIPECKFNEMREQYFLNKHNNKINNYGNES